MLPLLQSGMPFDDIRRVFGHLQRTELAHLAVLDSVWVRARLHRCDLGDFLARPGPVLRDFLHRIDPGCRPVTALPPMRDPAGLDAMLRRLRNAGLPPRLPGIATGVDLPRAPHLAAERAAE